MSESYSLEEVKAELDAINQHFPEDKQTACEKGELARAGGAFFIAYGGPSGPSPEAIAHARAAWPLTDLPMLISIDNRVNLIRGIAFMVMEADRISRLRESQQKG